MNAESQRHVLALLLEANTAAAVSVLRGESASPLSAIAAARTLESILGDVLQALAIEARNAGSTWQQIADVLQTTRQNAYQRFGRTVEQPPEEHMDTDPVVAQALQILDDYMAKRWTQVRKDFDERMSAGLSEQMLEQGVEQMTAQLGPYMSRGDAVVRAAGGYAVVDVPVRFEQAEMKFRVSIDGDGRVGGMFVLNPAVA